MYKYVFIYIEEEAFFEARRGILLAFFLGGEYPTSPVPSAILVCSE